MAEFLAHMASERRTAQIMRAFVGSTHSHVASSFVLKFRSVKPLSEIVVCARPFSN